MPKEDIQALIEEYVIYLKKTVNPNSVGTMMRGIKHFFIMNKIQLFWDLIQKMYPEKIKPSGEKPFSNENIRSMLLATTSKRNKTILHFLASTGSRIGIFDYELSMKHLKDVGEGCKAVLVYAGETEEYWSFLTPEATDVLKEYFDERKEDGEKLNSDSPIFRSKYSLGFEKAKPLRLNSVQSLIFRILQNSDVKRIRINKNYDIQMAHGFRKRFNTILKLKNEVNSNIAEKILGHSVTHKLDNTYFVPSIDELFNEFKKAIPELTISEALRLKEQNKLKDEKIKTLESDKDRRMANLEQLVSELANRLDSKLEP